MKKLLYVIGMLLLLGAASVAYANTETKGKTFSDVSSANWAYASVNAMSQKGILTGYPDGTFKPGNPLTYGQFIKMALIAATNEDIGNSSSGNWALSYYHEALEQKYFGTTDIKESQLNSQIPRTDMALIISNILGDIAINNYDELEASISDVDSTTKNDYDIMKAYATGILTGYADGTFKPNGTLTRAEAVTVIHRLVDESKRVLPEGKKEEPVVNDSGKSYKTVNTKDYFDPATVYDVKKTNTGTFEDTAEFYTDASLFDFKMNTEYQEKNGEWDCSFTHILAGYVYLVKDGKITTWCQTTPMYDEDANFLNYFGSISSTNVRDADYIVVASHYSQEKKTWGTVIVVNPFKQ
ncbi:S-layer homology domain-containing protein [Clostridium aminobutyricum]|uniref:S-layer homology domain-containing protein n=1 Tax=Clostridium aminobutyricum TaxID=33953 RepID=A0A939IJB3_CLOAM|nr:S-layer homology domain-containing protein [Clostridium aminobutyricum]MBN7773428.1 S-layer homology domain-containing protein [Clostridium aminobutyricum]